MYVSEMELIRRFEVPPGQVGIWFLGQNGFIFKSPQGTLAGVDLYLTDACAEAYPALNLHRRVPVLIPPEELELDVFACTHNHLDHTDPHTIRALKFKDRMRFVGPHPSCQVFEAQGVPAANIDPAWPDCDLRYSDLSLRGTFALPTSDDDLNHMGFVLQFGDGPRVWVTGDTASSELLYAAARHRPDVVIICINGGFNNLSHWEAAQVVARVKPKVAIPCHYDIFPDNAADPAQFRAALQVQAPDVRYVELEHGKPFVF